MLTGPRDFLAPTSPHPRGACSVAVVGEDGTELLDGKDDGGHLVLPASAVDEDGDQVLLQASLQESVAKCYDSLLVVIMLVCQPSCPGSIPGMCQLLKGGDLIMLLQPIMFFKNYMLEIFKLQVSPSLFLFLYFS